MIKWNKEYYEHAKRINTEKVDFYKKHFPGKELKPICANIDVWVCPDGLSFRLPNSLCRNACYGDDLNKCFNEINDAVIKEFPNLYNKTYFIIHNAPGIKFTN